MTVQREHNGGPNGHLSTLVGNGFVAKPHVPPHGFGTRAIHVGSDPSPHTGAVIPPISLSTTYKQDAVGVHKGFDYTRSGNPNRDAFEATLASLESGGAHALTFASGCAAAAVVLQSIGSGAHILSVNDLYGGTFRYMTTVAKDTQDISTTFLDLESAEDKDVLAAIQSNTKLIWIESPTNPTLRLVDIARITSLAHAHPSRPLVLVDNTFLTPFFASPLLQHADIVLHSLTKYINGHSDVLMGAVVLPAQHAALAARLRFLQKTTGAVPSAHDAWLAQRGAKTLHLRMPAHALNALRLARVLTASPYVREVLYPGLATHPRHARAYASLSPHARAWVDALPGTDAGHGDFPYGGMLSFRIASPARPGVSAATVALRFLTAVKVFVLAESLGGVESLAELPSRMTHGSIPETEREMLGIGDDLIRLSVGIEEAEDLIWDVEQALEIAFREAEGDTTMSESEL